jgi:flavin-dependent dehydrogenase
LCKTLVGADGGVSKTARLGNVQKVPRYISVQCAYEADERYFMYYSFFDIRLTDFYGWMIPKADKLVVGYAVSEDRYKKDSMEVLVRRMRELGINPGRKNQRAKHPHCSSRIYGTALLPVRRHPFDRGSGGIYQYQLGGRHQLRPKNLLRALSRNNDRSEEILGPL